MEFQRRKEIRYTAMKVWSWDLNSDLALNPIFFVSRQRPQLDLLKDYQVSVATLASVFSSSNEADWARSVIFGLLCGPLSLELLVELCEKLYGSTHWSETDLSCICDLHCSSR